MALRATCRWLAEKTPRKAGTKEMGFHFNPDSGWGWHIPEWKHHGKADLSLIKSIDIKFSPLVVGGRGSKTKPVLNFWQLVANEEARLTNRKCEIRVDTMWDHSAPEILVTWVNGYTYRPWGHSGQAILQRVILEDQWNRRDVEAAGFEIADPMDTIPDPEEDGYILDRKSKN